MWINFGKDMWIQTAMQNQREDVEQEDTLIPVLPGSDVSTEDATAQPEPPLENRSPSTGATLSTTTPRRNPPRNRRPPDQNKL